MSYTPLKQTLEKYADLLVNFALGGGKGIKKGDVVYISVPEAAKPLYAALMVSVLKAGGHPLGKFRPNDDSEFNLSEDFYNNASEEQITYFPKKYLRGLVDEIDHQLAIIAEKDKYALKNISGEKIMARGEAYKPYKDWIFEKENKGKLTWTVALYGTEEMAKEVGLSTKEYWKEIIRACYLDKKDPVKEWREVTSNIKKIENHLNSLPIEKLHVVGEDADLWITLGEKRTWVSGRGANIPSFEIFTSPDWRGTEGWIRFNQPLYRYGNMIEGVALHFEKGKVVKSSAKKNEKLLKDMVATKNADKVGEFSLTDRRFSRIRKFMGETLYDENVGGPHGNTHIALGNAYRSTYDGNPDKVSKKKWRTLGFNESSVHTDIVSTAPRTVTAHLKDGSEKIIYTKGSFTF